MMEALTAFDAIVLVLIIVSSLMALARGFMRELATLGAFLAAITAAFFARQYLTDPLGALLPEEAPVWIPHAVIFVSAFLIIYIIVAWFGAHLSRSIQGVEGISLLDRLAGGVFGFARGAVVLVFFVYLLNLGMDKDQIPEFISQARTYPMISAGADYLEQQAPITNKMSEAQPVIDETASEE